ncbi:50S ribosomal protein L10 [Myxococcota bacterium]|nr:50S ribosomal protein L10 [Myxococcota bacterium]MBU1430980.1 50S ribosomal protein L10 [Myxococcota bacterium]MBU1897225.1 50S ribosomal protein L10 [Myxococcota bacterium]
MNRTDKTAVIERLRDALANAPAVIVADFQGLTVEDVDQLRSEMRKVGVVYEVVKNTLARQAVAGTRKETMASLFKGNSAIAYHENDPTAPAKVLKEFVKDHEKLTIKGGWLDGVILDPAGVEQLASLPGKDELRGKLLSVFNGVSTKFVRTLAAGSQTFLRVLVARKDSIDNAA